MSENEELINSEIKTKTLYRNIAYTGWVIFIIMLVLWVLEWINGDRVGYGMLIAGLLGGVFTFLMARKKIPGEDQSDPQEFKKVTEI